MTQPFKVLRSEKLSSRKASNRLETEHSISVSIYPVQLSKKVLRVLGNDAFMVLLSTKYNSCECSEYWMASIPRQNNNSQTWRLLSREYTNVTYGQTATQKYEREKSSRCTRRHNENRLRMFYEQRCQRSRFPVYSQRNRLACVLWMQKY